MNYSIEYSDLNDLIRVKTSGAMTGADFVAMGQALLAHPQWQPGAKVLFDHRDLDFSQVSLEDLEAIRSFHTQHEAQIGSGKSAMVLEFGAIPEWETLWAQGEEIQTANQVQVFDMYDVAVEWMM